MSGHSHWGGDPLPPGLTPDDRVGWKVVATILVRMVPDPDTGEGRGLSLEYDSVVPKVVLVHQLMGMINDLMTHDDFQDGIPLQAIRDEADEEEDTDG